MKIRTTACLSAALLFGGAGVSAISAQATGTGPKTAAGSVAPTPAPEKSCTVTVSGDSIKVNAAPLDVQASLTSAIGDSITATFPATSKVNVLNVWPGSAANALKLSLNTSEAAPGSYPISLKGTKGECKGTVKVVANP